MAYQERQVWPANPPTQTLSVVISSPKLIDPATPSSRDDFVKQRRPGDAALFMPARIVANDG
jgi:hypothetical protein